MTKFFVGLIWFMTLSLYAQEDRYQDYYIIGDHVNVRSDTGLSSKVTAKANFGERFYCIKFDSSWHECQSCNESHQKCYISSKYLANDQAFILVCEEKNRNDLATLLKLERLYSNKGEYEKAVNTSIAITELYRNNPTPTKEESCALNRELPCYSIVLGKRGIVKYKTQVLSDYFTKIINESKDSLLVCWALITMSRCNGENGFPKLTIELLLKVINDYGKYLVVPEWCAKNYYETTSFMSVLYRLHYFAQNANEKEYEFQNNFMNELEKICNDPKANIASKAIACNLVLRHPL